MKGHTKIAAICLFVAGASLLPALAFAQVGAECPDHREGGVGPYDYTEHRADQLNIIEQHHFTPRVENLIGGISGPLGAELDYTIRAVPNHHRALDALSKLSVRLKEMRPYGLLCSVDGYFERAVRFKPNDARLHMIYGLHLFRWKKIDRAKAEFEKADKLDPDDVNIAYNLGLVYADLKQWDKASQYAEKAYAGGFPLPGLKNILVKAGKWKAPKVVEGKVDESKAGKSSPEAAKVIEPQQADIK